MEQMVISPTLGELQIFILHKKKDNLPSKV